MSAAVTYPVRPAAYISRRGTGRWAWHTMIREAIARGWPAPEIYAEDSSTADGCYGPALDRLEAAITAGRYDALLIAAPADPGRLMRLLSRCTRHGVSVSFLPGPASSAAGAEAATAASATVRSAAAATEIWDVLAHAQLEALARLFPDWTVWVDRRGWHARRRGKFLQRYHPGAPAFHVNAETALDLAGRLCWQQTAESHAADGTAAATA
jgi:hypothetical protein